MSEATEKQTAILLKNGYKQEDINSWNKAKISEVIGGILGNNKKPMQSNNPNAVIGTTGGISEVKHIFQNAFEFGPAGNRHNIRYWDIEDLKKQMQEIEDAGYFVEREKI
jgi:hypothetical protein